MKLVERITIQAFLVEVCKYANQFNRFRCNKILYHYSEVGKIFERNNSVIKTSRGTYVEISKLLSLTANDREHHWYVVICDSFDILDDVFCKVENISLYHYLYRVVKTENIIICKPWDIKKKCIYASFDDQEVYILRLVNDV